jgi:hypothetical protein
MSTNDATPKDLPAGWLEAAVLALAMLVLGAVLSDRSSAAPRCGVEPAGLLPLAGAAARPAPTAMELALHDMLTHD